jgi:acetate kinase
MTPIPILVINSGSSSIKFTIFQATAEAKTMLFDGAVDGVGTGQGSFHVTSADGGKILEEKPRIPDREAAFKLIAEAIQKPPLPKPGAIGHRVVAGGPKLRDHQRLTPEVLAELERRIGFAPLHNPSAIYIIRRIGELFPGTPNFVCFDSAFHQTIPEVAARFAIPDEYWQQGVRRYGAHGLSCESILYQLKQTMPGKIPARLIIAHLGGGCSVTAVKDGQSVETSMGLTPTGGIVSATRTGDLDPGVLLYILRDLKPDHDGATLDRDEAANQLETLVNRKSGMAGISGGTSDMRDLRAAIAKGDPRAATAVAQFVYTIRKCIGSYFAVLGGLDMLVLTGGIGQHDAATRLEICSGLQHLGIAIDANRNQSLRKDEDQATISSDHSAARVMVIPPQEDLMIANQVWSMLQGETKL